METHTDMRSPEDIYDDTISKYIKFIAGVVNDRGGDVTQEQYIALGHTVTTGILEREGVGKDKPGEYEVRTTITHETGELWEVSRLFNSVPDVTVKTLEDLAESADLDNSEEYSLRDELHAFSEVFEDKIVQIIEQDMEENNG